MRAGELRVVTRNLPSAYYLGASGPQGPEFDLASRFAAELGVRLFMYSVPNVADAMRELESHRAHIAAAGLTRGIRLPDNTSFGPPYQQVREHLIFRQDETRPRTIKQANEGHIEVVGGSAHAATLEQWRALNPNLTWVENPLAETEELLYRLSRREFDYTVADSNEFAIGRAFHPEIRIAFDLTQGKSLAWVVDTRDASLLKRVTAFYSSLQRRGAARLHSRYVLRRQRSLRLHPVARLHRAHRDAAAAVPPLVSRGRSGGRCRLAAAGGGRLPGVALGSDCDFAHGRARADDAHRRNGARIEGGGSARSARQHLRRCALFRVAAQSDSEAHPRTGSHVVHARRVQRRRRPPGGRAHPDADARQESRRVERRARAPAAADAGEVVHAREARLRARLGAGALRGEHPRLHRHPGLGGDGYAPAPVPARDHR